MLQATRRWRNRKRGARQLVRFPGIVEDAAMLGVERTHLYRVLKGERESRRLTAAWKQLQAEKGAR